MIRATIRDVALEANVGKSTVSRVLRHDPNVAASTRERVEAAIAKLGYRPDPALATIASHRWRSSRRSSDFTLAYVSFAKMKRTFPIDEMQLRGLARRAEVLGYRVELFKLTDYDGRFDRLARVIEQRGIRGMILGMVVHRQQISQLTEFDWSRFCVVGCNIGFYRPPIHMVIPNHFEGSLLAMRELKERGYRRIGLAISSVGTLAEQSRVAGLEYAQKRWFRAKDRLPLFEFTIGDRASLVQWVERHQFDALILRDAAEARWIEPARRSALGIVALSNYSGEKHWSGIDIGLETLGATSCDLLHGQLQNHAYGTPESPQTVLCPVEWREGDSCPRIEPEVAGFQ